MELIERTRLGMSEVHVRLSSRAKSSSPRPVHVAAVDTVRLAKQEAARGLLPGQGMRKLRLQNLANAPETKLSDAFLEFAASVVKPDQTLKSSVELLEDKFRDNQKVHSARAMSVVKRRSDAAPGDTGPIKALPPPEGWIGGQLETRQASIIAAASEAEERTKALEQEAHGLRLIVQKMLGTEAQLRAELASSQKEAEDWKQKFEKAKKGLEKLGRELADVKHQLEKQKEEQEKHHSDLRDGSTSPMMAFSTFIMGSERAGAGSFEEGFVPSMQWLAGEAPGRDGASKHRLTANEGVRQRHISRQHSTATMLYPESSMSISAGGGRAISIRSYVEGSFASHSSHALHMPDPSHSMKLSSMRSDVEEDERSPASPARPTEGAAEMKIPGIQASVIHPLVIPNLGDMSSPVSPSAVASCFPSLVPYLDFSGVEGDQSKAQAAVVNQSRLHLEKHLKMVEEQRIEAETLLKEIQKVVDEFLQRFIVWITAIQGIPTEQGARQDMQALQIMKEMMEWLAKRSFEVWLESNEDMEKEFSDHEQKLRKAVDDAARQGESAEVTELKKTKQDQHRRIEDLEEQLKEAKAHAAEMVPAAGRQKRKSGMGGFAHERGSFMNFSNDFSHRSISRRSDAISGRSGADSRMSGMYTADSQTGSAHQDEPVSEIDLEEVDENQLRLQIPRLTSAPNSPMPSSPTAKGTGLLQLEKSVEEDALAGTTTAGKAAREQTEHEARKMRLLRCTFAESIDLTLVPAELRVLLRAPIKDEPDVSANNTATDMKVTFGSSANSNLGGLGNSSHERFGLRQLRAVILEAYAAKRLDDLRRDRTRQPRRELHYVLQELMRRTHGVKKVVAQKSWQLLEAVAFHASSDSTVGLFADFLDGTRDLHELSFYLYCNFVLNGTVAEEGIAVHRVPAGYVSFSRAMRLADLLFLDLPKALNVVKQEVENCVGPRPPTAELSGGIEDFFGGQREDFIIPKVEVDELCKALLEGWRLLSLLLGNSVPHFKWRPFVESFLQADLRGRGWLDPNEVKQAEDRQILPRGTTESKDFIRLQEQTSLGAYIFRALHRCGNLDTSGVVEAQQGARGAAELTAEAANKLALMPEARRERYQAVLDNSKKAFLSLEKSLTVYLEWLLHSDEPRDLAMYQSIKQRIFGFKQAVKLGEALPSAHNLRCLLLLLLSHHFDSELENGEIMPDHLSWELSVILRTLREAWRHGISAAGKAAEELEGPQDDQAGEMSETF